jgi:hypothetical protein
VRHRVPHFTAVCRVHMCFRRSPYIRLDFGLETPWHTPCCCRSRRA